MANYYLRKFNGAAIDQFASLLFHVDDAQQMADFRDDQKQAEIEFFAQQLYDSEVPTFGRTTGLSSIGFSFNLQHFVGFMTNYFQDGQRDLHSPLFKRTCEVPSCSASSFSSSPFLFLKSLFFRFGLIVSVPTRASRATPTTIPRILFSCI